MSEINKLLNYKFIAGDYKKLKFNIYDSNNVAISTDTLVVKWVLATYGMSNEVLMEKTCSKLGGNAVSVEILSSESRDLKGSNYIQRVIVQYDIDKEVVYEGIITIL